MLKVNITDNLDIIWFITFTFIWSWLFWLPSVLSSLGLIEIDQITLTIFSVIAVFGPTIIAFLLTGIKEGKKGIKILLKRFNLNFNKKWLIPIFIVGPLISSFGLLCIFLFEPGLFPDLQYLKAPVSIPFVILYIFFLGGPFQEEFGWRGYALDRIQSKYNAVVSSLLLGIIHSLWHLPLIFITTSIQSQIPFIEFLLMTTLLTFFYTWLHNNTNGNVLIAMTIHLMGNLSSALFPYYVTTLGRWTGFFLLLIITIIIVKIYGPKKLVKNWNENVMNKNTMTDINGF